jgi:hypothetical protein
VLVDIALPILGAKVCTAHSQLMEKNKFVNSVKLVNVVVLDTFAIQLQAFVRTHAQLRSLPLSA